jgi:hypothetical protein
MSKMSITSKTPEKAGLTIIANPENCRPAEPPSPLTVGELDAFLRNLPSLGDDADAFTQDLQAIRATFREFR